MKRILFLMIIGMLFFSLCVHAGTDAKKEKKESHHGWLGISIRDVDEETAKKQKLDNTNGALIKEVQDDSPADSAGLKEGDVIIRFDGKDVKDSDGLRAAVRKTSPGTKVVIEIKRDGEDKILTAQIGSGLLNLIHSSHHNKK